MTTSQINKLTRLVKSATGIRLKRGSFRTNLSNSVRWSAYGQLSHVGRMVIHRVWSAHPVKEFMVRTVTEVFRPDSALSVLETLTVEVAPLSSRIQTVPASRSKTLCKKPKLKKK